MINEANCAKNCEDYHNGVCARGQVRPLDLKATVDERQKESAGIICNRSNFRIPALNIISKTYKL